MRVSLHRVVYAVEATLVVAPSTLFLVVTFPWLFAGPSLKAWGPSLVVLLLWIGGLIGIVALWQIFARLFFNKVFQIRLLLVRLAIGMISAATPVLFAYSWPPESGKRASFLLFLCPIAVGVHWALSLKRQNMYPSSRPE